MATDTSNTGRDSDKFMLRFPDGMRDRLKDAAKSNNRTMNAEIVARLEESIRRTARVSAEARLAQAVDDVNRPFARAPAGIPSADEIADKVAARLLKMIPIQLEDLESATPDYAKPGFRKPKSSKVS